MNYRLSAHNGASYSIVGLRDVAYNSVRRRLDPLFNFDQISFHISDPTSFVFPKLQGSSFFDKSLASSARYQLSYQGSAPRGSLILGQLLVLTRSCSAACCRARNFM
jgi:hypothetical protein